MTAPAYALLSKWDSYVHDSAMWHHQDKLKHAVSECGGEVPPDSPHAVAWSIYGALVKCYPDIGLRRAAANQVCRALGVSLKGSLGILWWKQTFDIDPLDALRDLSWTKYHAGDPYADCHPPFDVAREALRQAGA